MTPDLERPIRTLRDLTSVWEIIDGDHGYDAPQLFALHIDADDRLLPTVVQVYDHDFDDRIDEETLQKFLSMHGEIIRREVPGASLALMRARPGGKDLTADDRAWCGMAHRLLTAAPFGTRPLFFATDRSMGIVPPDALVPEAS